MRGRRWSVIGVLIGVCLIGSNVVYASEVPETTTIETVQDTDEDTQNVEELEVEDIDLGDYVTILETGRTQLLYITLLPIGSEASVQYTSSDESIATINAMGRITALQAGTVRIQVQAGTCQKEIEVTVVEPEEIQSDIPVSDIEIGDYETSLDVDATLTLSVIVLPSDASDMTVTYTSKSPSIATVSTTGEVKGISTGRAEILIQAGEVSKRIYIDVKVSGKSIQMNHTYLVLKQGDVMQLEADVFPQEASQEVTYSSLDSCIASVSSAGLITVHNIGSTGIIVSSEDVTSFVSVIVNESGLIEEGTQDVWDDVAEKYEGEGTAILQLLEYAGDEAVIEVAQAEYAVLTSNVIKTLYQNGIILRVLGEGYAIEIDGSRIKNYTFDFHTDIQLEAIEEGYTFVVNQGDALMGEVILELDIDSAYKYLYLYQEHKEIYEKLEYDGSRTINIDMEGTYILTNERLDKEGIALVYVWMMLVIVVGLIVTYIVVKKKHWFW